MNSLKKKLNLEFFFFNNFELNKFRLRFYFNRDKNALNQNKQKLISNYNRLNKDWIQHIYFYNINNSYKDMY